ncbi:putative type IX secretion system sortase PorU2 [Spirosoma endbachense]|uniref:Uncharacterized protein n=1 Tax=Spirosoma endbachense TaxID=2666025 RepID=A0A6P1W6Q6_9BACT|nr:C25 family cysteine peptidase [Spirosoma endbachense]QHV99600.1 hypothetical protein GJR95_33360 [Spirosoma endbachense]
MLRNTLFALFALIFAHYSWAQTPLPGNEWINYQQAYYKIPIVQNGLYRITAAELQKAGIPINSIDPATVQLFHRGLELAIYMEGAADNKLDASDFLEFYGRRNDGAQDSLLYRPINAQPHQYYNLFSDTTAYFLTWRLDGKPGKRMASYTDTDFTNLTPEAYHWEEELRLFTDTYPGWAAGIPPKIEYSHFEAGEGYTGVIQQKGKFYDNLFSTSNDFRDGPAPQLDLLLVGRDYINHKVECHVGAVASARRIVDSLRFQFYTNARLATDLLWSDVGSDGRVLVSTVSTGENYTADPYSVSYIRLRYPQRFVGNSQPLRTYRLIPNPSGRSLIALDNGPANSRFWDISDPAAPIRVGPTRSGTSVKLVVQNTETSRTLLSCSQPKAVSAILPVTFKNWSGRKPTYLIISHESLMKPAAGQPDAVKAYATYRASVAGGQYDTLTTTVQQLFDQFSYGERHPLAIRRFADQMLRQSNGEANRPRYLLLIGHSRGTPGVRRDPNQATIDLVLTAGFPGSDIVFTAGLDGQPQDVPAIPTGRINATSPQQVIDYLNKVKEFESTPVAQSWRKKLLHLSGGNNPSEATMFEELLEGYGKRAMAESLGATITAITKKTDNPVETINVAKQVNEGVGLMTFFGHSSLDVTDLDIGFCSNNALGYVNKGKYPLMLINGCASGNIFYSRPTFSSDWVLTPDRGAIAVIANSHLGYVDVLDRYSRHFYDLLADSIQLNRSIGQIQQETIRRTLAQVPGGWDLSNSQQMVLQGDPAIRLFPFDTPDYAIAAGGLAIRGQGNQNLTTLSDSVRLTVVVENYGQYRQEPLPIRIRRLVDGHESGIYNLSLPHSVAFRDTVTLSLPNDRNAVGLNQVEVILNPVGAVHELNRDNNRALAEFTVIGQGPVLIYPPLSGTVSTRTIRLTAQYLTSGIHTFDLELDTTARFDTPNRLSQRIRAETTISYPATLAAQPQTMYYWRVREADSTPKEWVTGSFLIDPASTVQGLPEGQIRLTNTLPNDIRQGDVVTLPIEFTNLAPYVFTDSLTVLQTIYAANLAQPLVTQWRIEAPTPTDTVRLTVRIPTEKLPGVNRLILTINPLILPESSFINNTLDLPIAVQPDLFAPVLEVALDGTRIEDGAPISAQPIIDVVVADENRSLIRRDTVGIGLFLQRPGSNTSFERLSWRNAIVRPTNTDNIFRIQYRSPILAEGLYHVLVTAHDAVGNAAAPYQVSFRIINDRRLTDLTVYPNPFRDQIKFSFQLTGDKAPDSIELTISDLHGRVVRRLKTSQGSVIGHIGLNEWLWDGHADSGELLPAGLYLYQLTVRAAGQNWPIADGLSEKLRGRIILTR